MNIVIAGVTCSGKTTLANSIEGASIMPLDNYFKDLFDIPKYQGRYLMDSINAFHHGEYCQDALELIRTGEVEIPRYDISSNRRLAKDLLILKREIMVFEGLHTIKILSEIPSLKVFLQVDLRECLLRRIERDSKKYGVPPKTIEEYFKECVIPMYNEYIEPQSKMADIVVKEGEDIAWSLKKYIKR